MTDSYLPHIGKNVIETLTLGMYTDSRFIYREYVQNSADQIDIAVEEGVIEDRNDGKINISINNEENLIVIEDNATGIESSQIRRFLGDIANSDKDKTKRKGFRGIGRLGGLGYCERLRFETSYKGESTKNIMILDAELLRQIIENRQDNSDAAKVISVITTIEELPESSDAHYFKVTLINVKDELLLNIHAVTEYLSMVIPVPFSPTFELQNRIKKHFLHKNFELDEYNVLLNSSPVYKAYNNFFVNSKNKKDSYLLNVGFFDVRDDKHQLLGLGWYGISDGLNKVLHERNIVRGIRIKKNNITIGDENTLVKRFPTERTNLRYIGEVHVAGTSFIPNARRDYFNENKTLEKFENSLDEIFKDFEKKLPHVVSILQNRLKEIINYNDIHQKFITDKPNFKSEPEQQQRYDEVKNAFNIAKPASKIIEKIFVETKSNAQIKDLFQSIVGENNYIVNDEIAKSDLERVFPPFEFSKVSIDQSTILNEVAIFLISELGYMKAEHLIKKLQKKYN